MADYTPTTEDIRAGWEYATAVIGDEGTAQFDRWLAQVKAQEREHVIKKLAAHALDRTILTAIVDLIEGEEQ